MKFFPLLSVLILMAACSTNSTKPVSGRFVLDPNYVRDLPVTNTVAEETISVDRCEAPIQVQTQTQLSSPTPEQRISTLDLSEETRTLQLAALRSREQAIEYAQRYSFTLEQVEVTRIYSLGQIWYVLTYGVYAGRPEAEQAQSELQAQGIPEPWIRRLAKLQRIANETSDLEL